VVHVDAGPQNLGGAVNSAMRGRVQVFIFAGMAPFTQGGEVPGSRTVPSLVNLAELLSIPVLEAMA
jgi:hypothetical protein